MVSVQPSAASPEAVDLIIKFHSSTQEPVYISADATEWMPQQMQLQGDAYEHVITVPRSHKQILYKFRIGDSNWVHDGTVPAGRSNTEHQIETPTTNHQTEPDGFWGFNNIFSIPELPVEEDAAQHPMNDFDEDTEVESIAAVESIADTASEAGADDARSNGEPELIDIDEVISDPDYPGMPESLSLTREQKAPTAGGYATVEQRSFSNLSVLASVCKNTWNPLAFNFFDLKAPKLTVLTAFLDSRSSASSLPEWCGIGLRSRY
jgi:hypothetical protein